MAGYHRYPGYKESDIDWIGDIPSHWDTRRAKFLFRRMQRPIRESDGVVTAFRDGEVTLRANRRTEGFTNSVKEIGYQGVRIGDLVVHAMDGFAGAIGVSDSDGKCSPVYSICTPVNLPKVNTKYYGFLLRNMAITGFVTALAKGIRERSTEFRYAEFKEIDLPFPPKNEQDIIIDFLNHETAKIDRLIAKQERLIELLKEKRQAVISHAVTKGLNPDVPMKDSGVEWLGEVPEHWSVSRLGFVSNLIQTGPFGSQLHAEEYVDGGVPVINPANIRAGEIIPDDQVTVDESTAKRLQRHWLSVDDIVFARRGELGRCALVTETEQGWICGTGSLKISLDSEKVISSFVAKFLGLSGIKDELSLSSKGSTMENLNAEILSGISMVFPEKDEQRHIVEYLHETEAKIEKLLLHSNEAINLLREHRSALISAAVTGKIDVRDWKNPQVDSEQKQTATA